MINNASVVAELLSTLKNAGLNPPQPIVADGSFQRFATSDPADPSGFYMVKMQPHPHAVFGDWRGDGFSRHWTYTNGELSDADAEALGNALAKTVSEAEATRAAELAAKTAEATQQWESATEDAGHDYLVAKQLDGAYGTRVGGINNTLLVPYTNITGELQSVERIFWDGTNNKWQKRWLGSPKGAIHLLGAAITHDAVLCEGFATGSSLIMGGAKSCVCCNSVDNLATVAQMLLDAGYDTSDMIVAGDWADPRKHNSAIRGRSQSEVKAQAVADTLKCYYIPTPDFGVFKDAAGNWAIADDKPLTDYNDYMTHANQLGLDGVALVASYLDRLIMSTGKLADLTDEDYQQIRRQQADLRGWMRKALDSARKKFGKGAGAAADPGGRETVATKLISLAKTAGIELWQDLDKNPWATAPITGHVEHHPLKTRAVKRYLQNLYYNQTEADSGVGKAANSEAMASALSVLEAEATIKGGAYPTYTRVGELDGAIYLDLANDAWEVVEITPGGWRVITASQCPVRFRRSRGMLALPYPIHSPPKSLELLAECINIDPCTREWRLIVGWLLSVLRGNIPYRPKTRVRVMSRHL